MSGARVGAAMAEDGSTRQLTLGETKAMLAQEATSAVADPVGRTPSSVAGSGNLQGAADIHQVLVVLNPVGGSIAPDEIRRVMSSAFDRASWRYRFYETT